MATDSRVLRRTLYKAQGLLEEAVPLLREALQACRETLGDQHPDTLASIYNLGLVLESSGEVLCS